MSALISVVVYIADFSLSSGGDMRLAGQHATIDMGPGAWSANAGP